MEFLTWLEQSSFSAWMRESPSVWAYPTILFLHTLGLGFLVGGSMVLDLRVLGWSKDMPLVSMKRFLPVMWIGFWVNAISGLLLVMIDATSLLTNPLFFIKLGCIALAVLCGKLIANQLFRDAWDTTVQAGAMAKALAGASLLFWVAAITAGRMTAYVISHAGVAQLR